MTGGQQVVAVAAIRCVDRAADSPVYWCVAAGVRIEDHAFSGRGPTGGTVTDVSIARQEPNPIALVLIAGTTVMIGAFIGAVTNAVNGLVSPDYFRAIMRWHDVENIWRACVAQGVFEGLVFGVFFSVVFTAVVGIVTRVRCTFAFAARHMATIGVAVIVCWGLGGLIAMGLALLSPEFYRSTFRAVPEGFAPMLGYAWVGGSIWGAEFGALLALVLGSILFAVHWGRSSRQ